MQFSFESDQDLKHRVNITIAADKIEKSVKNELMNIAKKVHINGFRKGKAPISIISQHYATYVLQDVLTKLMQYNFNNIIIQEKITLITKPKYIPKKYKIGKNFNYIVEFEACPKIELKGLNLIKVELPRVEIKETDIDLMLEKLRKQQVNWKKISDFANIEDRVTLDFSINVEGKEYKDSKTINRVLILGHSYMIPDFENGIIGHKSNESFEIDVKFPENYHIEELKGKNAKFLVKLKMVERGKLPELNEALIKNFGVTDGNLTTFRNEIRKNMDRELKSVIRNRVKNQVIDGLLKMNDILVPSALIKDEINILKQQMTQHLNNKNNKLLKLSSDVLEERAKRRVKTKLLLNEFIKKQKLKIEENRVKRLIIEIASAYQNPKRIIDLYNNEKNLMNNIRNLALEEQVVELLLDKMQVIEKNISFNDLIN